MAQSLITKLFTAPFAKKLGFPSKLAFDQYLSQNDDLQERIDDDYSIELNKTVNKIMRSITSDFRSRSDSVKQFVKKWTPPAKIVAPKITVANDDFDTNSDMRDNRSTISTEPEIEVLADISKYPEIVRLSEQLKAACSKRNIVASIKYTMVFSDVDDEDELVED